MRTLMSHRTAGATLEHHDCTAVPEKPELAIFPQKEGSAWAAQYSYEVGASQTLVQIHSLHWQAHLWAAMAHLAHLLMHQMSIS